MLRHLFIIGYDIASPRRLRRALKVVKAHAIGGQKSMYECWLTGGELQQTMRALIEPQENHAIFIDVDEVAQRAQVHVLGVGIAPEDGEFFYQG